MSLLICSDDEYGDYCKECGSTNIGETSIEEWETLQKESQQQIRKNYGKNKGSKGFRRTKEH